MKRSLYIIASLAILAGCSEFKDTNGNLESIPDSVKKSIEAGDAPSKTDTPAPSNESSFDLKAIASKPEADVTALLGKPIATENGEWTSLSTEEKTPFVRHTYKTDMGEMSVMFIEGIAARIEVKPAGTFKYPDDVIKAMRAAGLAVEDGLEPKSNAPHFLDFSGSDGVYAVRVVKDLEGNLENIGHVKIVTESRFK
ncbi:hypothetical protein ACFYU8_26090 [Brevibacillus sp. NPDC003359]|uniref:hypothetical protein n=1 Tax=unclassified Brevibacillus TaxID=2684853 RepID=UPI003687E600